MSAERKEKNRKEKKRKEKDEKKKIRKEEEKKKKKENDRKEKYLAPRVLGKAWVISATNEQSCFFFQCLAIAEGVGEVSSHSGH